MIEGHPYNFGYCRNEEDDVSLELLTKAVREVPPATAILGATAAGKPLLARLTADDAAHILITGDIGAGKTELLRTIASSLSNNNHLRDLQILALDPQDSGRLGFLPSKVLIEGKLISSIPSSEEASNALSKISETLRKRIREREQGEQFRRPEIVVVVDDYNNLQVSGNNERIELALATILDEGRNRSGVHLILATSKPQFLPDDIYPGYFPLRLEGKAPGQDTFGLGDFHATTTSLSESVFFQAAILR